MFIRKLFLIFLLITSCANSPPSVQVGDQKNLSNRVKLRTVRVISVCDGTIIGYVGSGVVVTRGKSESHIATAYHVVEIIFAKGCRVGIVDYRGFGFVADLVAKDEAHDVAIIRINDFIMAHADIDTDPFPGQNIICSGFPLSIASKKSRPLHVLNTSIVATDISNLNLIKIRDPVYNGFSGGPCFSYDLNLVGLVVAYFKKGNTPYEFYVTPSKYIKRLLNDL